MLTAFMRELTRANTARAAYSSLSTTEAEFREKNPRLQSVADSIAGYRRMIQESGYSEDGAIPYMRLIKRAKEIAALTDPQEVRFFENWVDEIEDEKRKYRVRP